MSASNRDLHYALFNASSLHGVIHLLYMRGVYLDGLEASCRNHCDARLACFSSLLVQDAVNYRTRGSKGKSAPRCDLQFALCCSWASSKTRSQAISLH
mmetsp:Transcript_1324/g.2344  ORF Transcript_1324/g.2344 Transcript_1324/m.2344 type:complete len:98 (-) Transcript_1324:31-324(-)